MSWLSSIGLGFASAFLTAIAGGWFANLQSSRLGEVTDEQGWRFGFYALGGFAAGFVGGVLIARFTRGGFLRGFAIAASLVLAASFAGAVVDRRFGWVPKRINGEKLILQVEMKLPQDWTPGVVQDPDAASCFLLPNGDRGSGTLEWNRKERREDGRWVLPCWFELRAYYDVRQLTLGLGKDYTDPSGKFRSVEWFFIDLPPEPYTEKERQWTPWSAESSNPQYEFRLRILRESLFAGERETARASRRAEQWNHWKSLDANAPMEQWMEPFDPGPDARPADAPPDAAEKLQALVDHRSEEFRALLLSPDRKMVREAVYALSIVPKIPASMTPALIEAGTKVSSYAATARDTPLGVAQDHAEDIAWDFFERWTETVGRASAPKDNARYRVLLDEIQKTSGRRHSVFPTDLPSRLVRRIDKIKDAMGRSATAAR